MKTIALMVVSILASVVSAAEGGTIQGTVRDQSTLLPLAGFDVDILDDRLRPVGTSNDITAIDGTYSIAGLNDGLYFVRIDATPAQGYVDEYYPGTPFPSSAVTISVGSASVVTGIDFDLSLGTTISGTVVDPVSGAPLAGYDMDLVATDGTLLASIDATTAADGTYSLGAVGAGSYFVRFDADPLLAQFYVDQYWASVPDLASATPIVVGATPVVDVNLAPPRGGTISGIVRDATSGLPVEDIDIDIFDLTFQEVLYVDAATEANGTYTLGSLPPGSYYVLADPDIDQPYFNTFFPAAVVIEGATLVTVAESTNTVGIDVDLSPFSFISGQITQAGVGTPLPSIDLDLLDTNLVSIPGLDDHTAPDGTYIIGPVPNGTYYLRADATQAQGWVDRYHPGAFLPSSAGAIVVAGASIPGIDFQLSAGVNIVGTVRAANNAMPLSGVDLDVFSLTGEAILSVDGDSDLSGAYAIGALPPGSYLIRAEPLPASGYGLRYYDNAPDLAQATTVVVTGTGDTANIDFSLPLLGATATEPIAPLFLLEAPYPNPFSARVAIGLRATATGPVAVSIFDLRGRRVRTLTKSGFAPATQIIWDGTDEHRQPLSSGTYFVQARTRLGTDTRKLVLTR